MIDHPKLAPLGAVLAAVLTITACGGPTATTTPSGQPTATPTRAPAATTATPGLGATPTPAMEPSFAATPGSTPVATQPSTPPASATPLLEWRQINAAGPSAREDHTWTVDGDGGTGYLFGGRGPGGASNDLWAFDLAANSWSQLQPGGDPPAPRFGHTATWVPDVGLVVWSGQAGSEFFDDIWAYEPDANAWSQLESLGDVPAARYGSCASLGPDGELWISHGFTDDSGRFSDTRSYDFASGTWTDRTPVDRVPVDRCLHDCFWSSVNQLILYGGQTTGVAALGDIWAYDLASGTWTQGETPDAPARQLYALAHDDSAGFVFGGAALDGTYLADLWRLEPATLELVPVEAGSGPPARSGATLIVDALNQRSLLFGGQNQAGALADTWEFGLP